MADCLSLDGADELLARIEAARTSLVDNVSRELYGLSNDILGDSLDVVPVDKGALMASGYVTLPEQQGDLITCTIGYGGPAAPYAAAVHEMLDGHVHWSRPGSGPKYLENPFKARQGELPERIGNAVRDSFSK